MKNGKVKYNELINDIYIVAIREDECTSYFIKLSNDDIVYIYKWIDGMEVLYQDFEIVSPNKANYKEVIEYMNEEWVKEVMVMW